MAGAVHHVYARGNARRLIYLDDRDRQRYLDLLAHVVAAKDWACMAYCLMPNHVHLLIETLRPNLGDGMQWLHGRYAAMFNKRHATDGHLFQGRYGAVRVTSDAQLWTVSAYIARNPVAAGLCAKPHEWRWSSYAANVNRSAPAWLAADRLLSYLASFSGQRRRKPPRSVELSSP